MPHLSSSSSSSSHQRSGRKNSILGWPVKVLSSSSSSTLSSATSLPRSKTPEPVSTIHESDSTSTSSPHRTPPSHRHRRSISISHADSVLRRSISLRSSNSASTGGTSNRAPSAKLALSYSPEKGPLGSALSISGFGRSKQKSSENVRQFYENGSAATNFSKPSLSAAEAKSSVGMQAIPLRHAAPPPPRPPGTSHSNYSQSNGLPAVPMVPSVNGHSPLIIFQHIHDMASKRISTLDYLRKAHEGRVYWFNTLLFGKSDLARLQFFEPRRLARRATNYLILGFSLPTILDLNSQSPTEYLRALNALLVEFETYQTTHPPDGSTPSSLTRSRIPQMFKRANPLGGGKGRRSSSAADLSALGGSPDFGSGLDASISTDNDLLPGEEYSLLLTPSLPFDPDFFETFATLCDVLIDCYTKVMSLVSTPDLCPPGVGDLFAKADARVRKIIVAGVVREFEDASRQGVKGEMAGVGKVVLGGLM